MASSNSDNGTNGRSHNGVPPSNGSPNGSTGENDASFLSGLSGVSIKRPVFTAMMMVALIVLGFFSFRQLPIDQYPDIEIPVVTVQTVYPGASPETIEREVSRRLEESFNTVEGVDNITSTSLEGVSLVIVELELSRDVDLAAQDVRAKIESVRRDLPGDIDAPVVQKFDPSSQPIISLGLSSGSMPLVKLTQLGDETIRRRIESVPGVGEVRLTGGLEREIRVFLQPDRMEALGVSVTQVMGALQRQNQEVPAGRIERPNTEDLVRVTGRIAEPDQFNEIIVANRAGEPIRLSDVARVKDATEEERSVAMLGTARALSLDILKVSGANTVAVAEGVKEAVHEIRTETLPAGASLQVVRDNSVKIRHSVEDVIFELILGAILCVIVVMFFLNDWKATLITALALPVSVISAFVLMGALGFTLNVITLLGLSLSIGILIDDAIVVIENIVRHREMGAGAFRAAGEGTSEIFLAVMATTFSIVAVFVPVAFMRGIIGRFFYEFGLTVAWAVLVSLFVSFTLTPMLAANWGVDPHDPGEAAGNPLSRFIAWFNRGFDRLAEGYRSVVDWALRHRKSTMGIAIASFIGAIMLFPYIGGGFMPPQDSSEFSVVFETPDGSSLQYTRSKAEAMINALQQEEAVDYTYTTIGGGQTGTVTDGETYVKLVPTEERDRSQQKLMTEARAQLKSTFGVDLSVLEAGGLGGARAPLAVEVRGPDVNRLQAVSQEVENKVAGVKGVVDVKNSMGRPRPEYRIDVRRNEANELGLDVGQVAATVRPFIAGQDVTTWEDPTGEERDVTVQVAQNRRASRQNLDRLPIALPGRGRAVPLGQIAQIESGVAPAQIDRKNLKRVVTISASTTPDVSIADASAGIRQAVAEMNLPQDYEVNLGGETENLEETGGYVLESLMLAVILIFLILASQFESFTQPFAIMLSLPLSLVGVLLALLVTDDTLNMMSMIGVLMLMGLVTKNAILLVDNANEQLEAGLSRFDALKEAGAVRFRPIMMTTLAMIAGMLPIALAMGEGGGFRAPMARAVIGGLITSTLLTLVVVPVAYTYFDDFGAFVKRMFSRSKTTKEAPTEREPETTERSAAPSERPAPAPAG